MQKKTNNKMINVLLILIGLACVLWVFAGIRGTSSNRRPRATKIPTRRPASDPTSVGITLTYVVEGTASQADLTWRNEQEGTQQAKVNIPHQIEYNVEPGYNAYISAQNSGESGTITCKIIINSELWRESTSSGAYKITTCSGLVGSD
jgi:hypothetical protein